MDQDKSTKMRGLRFKAVVQASKFRDHASLGAFRWANWRAGIRMNTRCAMLITLPQLLQMFIA